jgi:hypothetical protein
MSHLRAAIFCSLFIISAAASFPAQDNKPAEKPEGKISSGKVREQIVGTWKLFSIEESIGGKNVIYPLGQNPVGYLMYDSIGNMSQQLMDSSRPAVSLRSATIREVQDLVFNGFDAYSGTYSIDEVEGSITYKIECSLYPTVVGTTLKRKIECSEDKLLIKSTIVDPDKIEHTRTITWMRVK